MNVRKGGLGRGLGALIPTGEPPTSQPGAYAGDGAADQSAAGGDDRARRAEPGREPVARFRELPVGEIRPNPRQPRGNFDADAMAELVASIREVGLLQPVVVRETGPREYELVMGERRWRASRQAGLDLIPAIIRDTPDDAMLRDALLENLHRQELNPLEEAAAYSQLLEEFGATHEELAGRIGRSRSQVSNTLRLLNLPAPVQRRVAAGVLSAGHARALLGLPTGAEQEDLAARIVAEGLSVRAVEEIVALRARGDDAAGTPGQGRRSPRSDSPELRHVADLLSDRYETRVKVEMGRSRGRITLEFASMEDLQRILATMAPDAPTGGVVGAATSADVGPTDGVRADGSPVDGSRSSTSGADAVAHRSVDTPVEGHGDGSSEPRHGGTGWG